MVKQVIRQRKLNSHGAGTSVVLANGLRARRAEHHYGSLQTRLGEFELRVTPQECNRLNATVLLEIAPADELKPHA